MNDIIKLLILVGIVSLFLYLDAKFLIPKLNKLNPLLKRLLEMF